MQAGNKGRDHIYPIYGSKNSNNVYNATAAGEYYNPSAR